MKKSLLSREQKSFIRAYVKMKHSNGTDYEIVADTEYEISKMLDIRMTLENRNAVEDYLEKMVGEIYFNDKNA